MICWNCKLDLGGIWIEELQLLRLGCSPAYRDLDRCPRCWKNLVVDKP